MELCGCAAGLKSACVRRGGHKDKPGHVAFTLHDPVLQTSATDNRSHACAGELERELHKNEQVVAAA